MVKLSGWPRDIFAYKLWLDITALIAGLVFTLAFAPFNQAYLALLALTLLFLSWLDLSPLRAFWRGYLFGLGSFGLGVSWVYVSMHDYGGAHPLVAGLLTALFVAFWALFPAIAAFLSVTLIRRAAFIIGFPSLWLGVEYVRGTFILNGFPWLQLAYSQLETPLAGYVPVVGAYGAGYLLALSAAILLTAIIDKHLRQRMLAIFAIIWLLGASLQSIAWTRAIAEPISVAMVQGSVTQDQKWRPENRLKTLQFYRSMTEAHLSSALVIWPETAIPAYLSDVYESFLLPISQLAQQKGTDLVISVPAHGQAPNEKYNAVITLGKTSGMYRKSHLLPFGEYMPWQPFSGYLLGLMNIRLGMFTPGDIEQPLLQAAGYSFATSICYEDAFAGAAIRAMPEAAFLVNVTNDGWFGNTIEPHQHLQIARMRAIETGRFMLRSTNTGVTAIIAPDGRIISQAPLFQPTVLAGWFTPMSGMTPYAKLGDKPVMGLILLILGVAVRVKRYQVSAG